MSYKLKRKKYTMNDLLIEISVFCCDVQWVGPAEIRRNFDYKFAQKLIQKYMRNKK